MKHIALLILVCIGAAHAGEIRLTIVPVTNLLLATDASDRLPNPPHGIVFTSDCRHPDSGKNITLPGGNIVLMPTNPAPEHLAWASNNAFRVDFFASIQNTSSNTLKFYNEWNSWGFYRLKLVCYGAQEVWICKQPGTWYRNFPSWTMLPPGGEMLIPVAFDDAMWDGVARAKAARGLRWMRLFYDQLDTPANKHGITTEHWQGHEYSQEYDIGYVLPRRGFKASGDPRQMVERSQPDEEIRIDLK